MPEITVKIKYEQPDAPYWMNPDNVAICLHKVCRNTKFEVTWAPGGDPWKDGNYKLSEIPIELENEGSSY